MTQGVKTLANFMSSVLGWKQWLEDEPPLGTTYHRASTMESLLQLIER